jgi:hypothetical protein
MANLEMQLGVSKACMKVKRHLNSSYLWRLVQDGDTNMHYLTALTYSQVVRCLCVTFRGPCFDTLAPIVQLKSAGGV